MALVLVLVLLLVVGVLDLVGVFPVRFFLIRILMEGMLWVVKGGGKRMGFQTECLESMDVVWNQQLKNAFVPLFSSPALFCGLKKSNLIFRRLVSVKINAKI